MNDRIRELAFFLRVSEMESFSAAGRNLGLDPSTISKVIGRLESRLGVRLFNRTSRVLQLTQEGQQFTVAAQKVMTALDEADSSANLALTEATGILRISSTPAFARNRLAPLMSEFLKVNPALRVEFLLTATPPDLFEQQIDISFQSGNIPDSTLVARRIASTRWKICASPSYLEIAGIPKTPADLNNHQCLNFLPGSYRSRWSTSDENRIQIHEPKAVVTANNGDMLCTLAVMGMGLARLADYHISDQLENGQLVTVLEEFQEISEPIYAVFVSKRHLSTRVRVFLDFISERISDG